MKCFFVLPAILLPVVCFCQAPGISWQKSFGGSYRDQSYSVSHTFDGGYIVAGYEASKDSVWMADNHGYADFWLLKLNSHGDTLWKKCYGTSYDDFASSVKQTADSGYIVAGTTYSDKGDIQGDFLVVKTDKKGEVVWQKIYGKPADEGAGDIIELPGKGYLLAGYSAVNKTSHGYYDYRVIRLDTAGEVLWDSSYGGLAEDRARSIKQTYDGGFIIAGFSFSIAGGDVTGNYGLGDYWIVKADSAGVIQWQKNFGGTDQDVANDIQVTPDSGYIVAGYTASNNGDITLNHGQLDYWIIKLDRNGNKQWQKTYGGSGNDMANSIKVIPGGGGYIVAGSSDSNDGDVSGNKGGTDYWVIKINMNGSLAWQKCYGGSDEDFAACIDKGTDDAYIVTGWSKSSDGDASVNFGDWDYWVIKLDAFVLPVTAMHLVALQNNGKVLLKWATAAEQNSRDFIVERSNDGRHFTTNIATLPAAGYSATPHDYSCYDMPGKLTAPGNILYYRVTETDNDGKYSYSNIVPVNIGGLAGVVQVYPNPATDVIHVSLPAAMAGATVSITNSEGKAVYVKRSPGLTASSSLNIPLTSFSSGVYMVTVSANNTVLTYKIVKQ